MSLIKKPTFLPSAIAVEGDIRDIPAETPVNTNRLSYKDGFPVTTEKPYDAGGLPPNRRDFNAFLKLITEHIHALQSGMVYDWNGTLHYPVGCHVLREEIEYVAVKESGTDTVGAKDPKEYNTDNQPPDNQYWVNMTKLSDVANILANIAWASDQEAIEGTIDNKHMNPKNTNVAITDAINKIKPTISVAGPSGGTNGSVWFQYIP